MFIKHFVKDFMSNFGFECPDGIFVFAIPFKGVTFFEVPAFWFIVMFAKSLIKFAGDAADDCFAACIGGAQTPVVRPLNTWKVQ